MLSFVFEDIRGRSVLMNDPLCVNITQEREVPADSVSALFDLRDCDELSTLRVFDDDELIFRGVVDEQEKIISSAGAFLRISGRSMAALLLDNESVPVTYNHPSAGIIFERHVEPFRITTKDNPDRTYFSELVVTKGESNWQALSHFCKSCLSSVPRISGRGELFFSGEESDREVVFSDTRGDILYRSIEETVRRCEEISCVNIKVTNASGYHTKVENEDAKKRGILRERYLNAVLTDTPMNRADALIKSGREKGYRIRVRCEGRALNLLGAKATVKDTRLGEIGDLTVSALYYRLSPKDESTYMILRRRNS